MPKDIANKKILISPLDWGMGHTTRCVPIIHQLLKQNNQVIFAGNELQCNFIKREFPSLSLIPLEGYNITLDSTKSTYFQLIRQLPKLNKAITREKKEIEKIVQSEKIEVIISDNRYGLFSADCKNILITHQLNLQIPFFQKLVKRKLISMVECFDCCWIPDTEVNSLCSELIDVELKIPKLFIGHLCRFKKENLPVKFEYLGIVSGPEPERGNFAQKLDLYLSKLGKNVAMVGYQGQSPSTAYFSNPTTSELENLLNTSTTIISRAGYTTIMEIICLDKNAILIPTPGQFEQEYLSRHIHSERLTFKSQNEFF